jgi:hypothetical protein
MRAREITAPGKMRMAPSNSAISWHMTVVRLLLLEALGRLCNSDIEMTTNNRIKTRLKRGLLRGSKNVLPTVVRANIDQGTVRAMAIIPACDHVSPKHST